MLLRCLRSRHSADDLAARRGHHPRECRAHRPARRRRRGDPALRMAADIAALVADKAFAALKAPVKRVTAPHTPVPFAPSLEKLYIPSPERIADAVREVHGYSR